MAMLETRVAQASSAGLFGVLDQFCRVGHYFSAVSEALGKGPRITMVVTR